jgi:Fuc2NAc and GlcNAc transferase
VVSVDVRHPGVLTLLVALAAFLLSLGLTAAVRRYALKSALIDVPNDRSSHSRPMPRGGGLAIAVSWFSVLAGLLLVGRLDPWTGLALLVGGVLVAAVGWLDDRYRLAAWVRAGVHAVAAAWAVWCLGGLPSVRIGFDAWWLGWAGSILAVVGLVWLTNLYNFMDGIDGLAGGEAVVVGLIGGGLAAAAGAEGLALVATSLAAAAGGFMVFNWPPATIFMGDVGSGLLGYAFGVMALASERADAVPLLVWMLLLAVFIVDATATLIARLWKRERWYEAHRSHAYQRAVQAGASHRQVTVAILALDVLLGVAAAGALVAPSWVPVAALVAAGLLTGLWYACRRAESGIGSA